MYYVSKAKSTKFNGLMIFFPFLKTFVKVQMQLSYINLLDNE